MKKLIVFIVLFLPLMLMTGCKSEKEKMLSLGDEKFISGDFKGASAIYAELKEKHPNFLLAYTRLANCKLCMTKNYAEFSNKLSETKQASKFYLAVLNNQMFDETNPGKRFNEEERKSELLGNSNDIEFFDEAIDNNNDKFIYLFGRGVWHFVLKNKELAISDFNKATKLNPNSLEANLMKARCYSAYFGGSGRMVQSTITRNQFEGLKIYQDILAKFPDNEDVIRETAFSYYMAGQSKTGFDLVWKAYSKDTTKSKLLGELGFFLSITGNQKEGIKYMELLCKKFPNNENYIDNLALAKIQIGDKKGGVELLRKELELVKGNKDKELRIRSLMD